MANTITYKVPPQTMTLNGATKGRYGYTVDIKLPDSLTLGNPYGGAESEAMLPDKASYTARDLANDLFQKTTIAYGNVTKPSGASMESRGVTMSIELALAGIGVFAHQDVQVNVDSSGKLTFVRSNAMINDGGGIASVPATDLIAYMKSHPDAPGSLWYFNIAYYKPMESGYTFDGTSGHDPEFKTLSPPRSWVPSLDFGVISSEDVFDGRYYKGISSVVVGATNVTACNGATIDDDSSSMTGPLGTVGIDETMSFDPIDRSGLMTFTFGVYDSRRRAAYGSLVIPVYEHAAPTVEAASVTRCDEDGEEADEGTIAMLALAASPATDIATTTIASVSVRHRETGTTAWVADGDVTLDDGGHAGVLLDAAGEPVAFDASRQYEVEVTVTDCFGFTATRTLTLLRAFMTMDFLAGGRGIAFGQPATREGFDCAMDAYFDPPIPIGSGGTGQGTRARGMSALAYAGSVGTTTNWDALDPGIYTVASASAFTGTGAPKGVYTYGVLHCWKNGPDAVNPTMQVYMSHHGDVMVRQRWNGEFRTWTPASFTGDMIKLIGNLIHPVGSVYITFGSENPGTMFGGTWEKVEGKFLLGSSSGRAVGATGGEETHKLTATEMPAHDHGSKSLVGTFDFADNITLNGKEQIVAATSGIASVRNSTSNQASVSGGTTGSYSHKKGVQINATHTHSSNGGNGAHNNMPPYIAVNIWRRKS